CPPLPVTALARPGFVQSSQLAGTCVTLPTAGAGALFSVYSNFFDSPPLNERSDQLIVPFWLLGSGPQETLADAGLISAGWPSELKIGEIVTLTFTHVSSPVVILVAVSVYRSLAPAAAWVRVRFRSVGLAGPQPLV